MSSFGRFDDLEELNSGKIKKTTELYIESLLKDPPEVSIGEGKIHVFVAAITTNDFMETTNLEDVLSNRADPIKVERRKLINDGFINLKNNPRLQHDKVVFHMMPFINASQVAKFLATSPTITKAGGATAAEIATIGMHPAIFNMKITHIAPWEKANADVLSKNGLAIPLPYSDSDETKEFKGLKSAVEKAYTLRPQPLDDRGFGSDFFTSYQNEVFSDYNKTVLTNKGVPGLPSIKVMQNNSIKPPRFFKWRIR